MDKGLTVPKWVLINRPKILQMTQKLYAQIVCPSPKVWDFDEPIEIRTHLAPQNDCFKVCFQTTQYLDKKYAMGQSKMLSKEYFLHFQVKNIFFCAYRIIFYFFRIKKALV